MRLLFDSPQDYRSYFLELVEKERQAEREFHEKEILTLSGREREKRGRAILGLSAHYIGEILSEYHAYRFCKANMGEHEINVGDVVLASRGGNPLKGGIEGVVFEKAKKSLVLLFPCRIPKLKGKWRIDLFVNDVTFRRMKEALDNLSKSVFPLEIIMGRYPLDVVKYNVEIEKFFNPCLDESQKEAVKRALSASYLFIIHGPFGTGKTTTLVEVILQHLRLGYKILVTADSNIAVDGIVEKLIEREVKVVRIGHPARISRKLFEVTLDNLARTRPAWKEVEKLRSRRDLLREKQSEFVRPVPHKRRGLSDDEIVRFAEEGVKKRGLKLNTIKSMAEWIKIKREIDTISEVIRNVEESIIKEILDTAEVICTTNSGAGSDYLKDYTFDLVVIDEATQATEPSCIISIVKARKVILAGDHKQLPPTVLSQDDRLRFTLFERFMSIYSDLSCMLRVQYRMNDVIKEFPSRVFYGSQIFSHPSVRDIRLSDIVGKRGDNVITDDTPIVFIDTEGALKERTKKSSFSKHNPGEAKLIVRVVDELLRFGVPRERMGVITPYKDQEDLVRSLLPDGIEVKTVDGFQGREKEVIVLSLVRSNPEEEIGFLRDERRMNVALTRAKRKLIIVGDSETLRSYPLYRDLLNYVKERGRVVAYSLFTELTS
ncbi:MAG: IGHMBP2 family helicase [Thermosulfidibacteraceae bacterium]|jgi:predicted DNA helicase